MTSTYEGLLLAVTSGVLTLLLKWVWDRWLSSKSRVTFSTCQLMREKCQQQLLDKICAQGGRLDDGDLSFKSTRHYQRAVILTLLQLCSKLGVDCDQMTKILVSEDILQ